MRFIVVVKVFFPPRLKALLGRVEETVAGVGMVAQLIKVLADGYGEKFRAEVLSSGG